MQLGRLHVTQPGLLALANGACSGSLRVLSLLAAPCHCYGASLPARALRRGLPGLQSLQLPGQQWHQGALGCCSAGAPAN